MAELWRNSMDNGLADGTVMTLALSDDGTSNSPLASFATADVGSGNTWVQRVLGDGTRCWELTQGGANKNQLKIASLPAGTSYLWMTGQIWLGALPGASGPLARFFVDTGWVTPGIDPYAVTTSGKVWIRDGVAGTQSANSTPVLPTATWVQLTTVYDPATNTATTTFYTVGSTSPILSVSYSIATDTELKSVIVGIMTASTGLTLRMRKFIIGNSGSPVREDVVAAAPVVSLAAGKNYYRSITAGDTITDLSFTATDSDSPITGHTASVVAKPTGVTAPTLSGSATGTGTSSTALTVSATFPAPGTYDIGSSATDGTRTSNVAHYIIDVAPAVGGVAPLRASTSPNATLYGTPANGTVGQADGDDATGWEGPNGATLVVEDQTGPLGPNGIGCRIRAFKVGSGTCTLHTELWNAAKDTKLWETGGSSAVPDTVITGTQAAPQTVTIELPQTALAAIPPGSFNRSNGWWIKRYVMS